MLRRVVDSSVISSVGYDERAHVLEVEFRTGRLYHYYDVPRAEYDALLAASSVGSYFNREIRTKYKSATIAE